ncbi:DUF2642 domain-containing protein [Bacillus salipaludis]|uniref:DUF2642 domain-containing protein n=1 Tax=Bacillus salipaludis TaxID=2547811 RepID=A0A4R5VNW3_9BACI|nr:DUF2642 domain-containing protein [Bacillus salipaludis]MDQ6595886.1 DUF2642 domain-containing protein [Bacillus salipaludis]TDK59783.1 DUF2642 domain-containing protein [Bacillus salipaludis]
MNDFNELLGKTIEVEISGGSFHIGVLVDSGLDIIVIYDGRTQSFLYIPVVHIQRLKEIVIEEYYFEGPPSEKPIELETQSISFRKILNNAKGRFVQVYVTGNKSIHGYLTSILNDYFVFHSPAYKTMFISMQHVKWLIPYPENATPYNLSKESIPLIPAAAPLARTFEEQMKKLENQMVILDGGDHPEKIGLLQKVRNNKMTIVTAERETVYRNLEHIKTIQLP